MSDLLFWTKNLLWEPGAVLKNGTGGGAPALDEDVDWPMSNLLKKGRYLYWKTTTAPPTTTEVHFDLGSSISMRAAALVMNRGYPITDLLDFSLCNLYYSAGAIYPPTWTLIANLAPGGLNNVLLDFGVIAGRFWRFDVASSGNAASCKLWLIPDVNRVALGNEYSPETTERERKMKLSARTMAGIPDYFDPVHNVVSVPYNRFIRPDLVWRQVEEAQRAVIENLGTLDYPFLCTYTDGTIREFALEGGVVKWAKVFGPPALYDVSASMIELV